VPLLLVPSSVADDWKTDPFITSIEMGVFTVKTPLQTPPRPKNLEAPSTSVRQLHAITLLLARNEIEMQANISSALTGRQMKGNIIEMMGQVSFPER
jgi:hypothetical protein